MQNMQKLKKPSSDAVDDGLLLILSLLNHPPLIVSWGASTRPGMATLRASTSTRTSWATSLTITGRSIGIQPDLCINIGYRRLLSLSIQIAVCPYRFFRWIDAADVFLEYLPEPIAQRFRLAARAFDDEDLVGTRSIRQKRPCPPEVSRSILVFEACAMLPQT
jgi:hypothetical protein